MCRRSTSRRCSASSNPPLRLAEARRRPLQGAVDSREAIALRPATPADAEPIARLHTAVWRQTYRDLAPAEAYRILDMPCRLGRWTVYLADTSGRTAAQVAEVDGRLAGVARCGPPSHPIFGERGEVMSLYIDQAFARRGLGRRLLATSAAILGDLGYRGVALGVVDGNRPAIAFYEALGGCMIGRFTDPGPAWRSENLAYAWNDIPAALARLADV